MREMSRQYLDSLASGNALERACAVALEDAMSGENPVRTVDKMLRLLAGERRYSTMTLVYLDLTGNEWDTGERTQ